MAMATLTGTALFEDVTGVIGELDDISASAPDAVVLPGSALQLPPSTMRNLRSIAVLRLRSGPLWTLSVVGHRWTADRLAFVADLLEANGDAGPDAILINRVSDQLGLPNVQIEFPTMAELEGSGWNVRPLAVALGLARVFAGGSVARGAITSADAEVLAAKIRRALSEALARYRSRLDDAALQRCQDYGGTALRVYNYLIAEPNRRNRMQFGDVLPVFLQAVASSHDESPYREMRQAIDAGQPLAALVCQLVGAGPADFRGRRPKQFRHCCETKSVTPPLITAAGWPKPSNGAGFQGLRSNGVTLQSSPTQRSKCVTGFLTA